jgi:DNA replication protein DnaC
LNEKDLERISDIDRLREKEQAIVYDNNAFIEFVEKLESLVIYSTPGQGKTSLLTFLASVLSQTNKYANFPCHLP